jgi:hypothetical protein
MQPTPDHAPPIPVWLSHLPVVGGLVVPWITPQTADGRYLFGAVHPQRQQQAITQSLCSVCGRALDRPLVLLMRLADLPRQCTSEPALHPVCAAYTVAACPMVAGRISHYRSNPMRLGAGMAPADDEHARLGAPAEPWFAVWLNHYQPITDAINANPAASYAGIQPLRIRTITWRQLLPW